MLRPWAVQEQLHCLAQGVASATLGGRRQAAPQPVTQHSLHTKKENGVNSASQHWMIWKLLPQVHPVVPQGVNHTCQHVMSCTACCMAWAADQPTAADRCRPLLAVHPSMQEMEAHLCQQHLAGAQCAAPARIAGQP
jgi:hypothetical protein